MPRLVVISGPNQSGKTPLAMRLCQEDPALIFIGRDYLRSMYLNLRDEWHITQDMAELARAILRSSQSVCICAWNLEPEDRTLWEDVASETDAELVWLDTRMPDVHAMIPALDGWTPISE